MEKEFVPYEESLALKELGFDEPCFGYYIDNKFEFFADVRSCNTNSEFKFYPTALTYSQAFRWLREKHNFVGTILGDGFNGELKGYYYSITEQGWINYYESIDDGKWYDTYEEAELACLKKLIEIVKNG